MSDTEREALEAGSAWWEAEMFRGKPDWQYLLGFERTPLTEAEQSFLDNETETLCEMLDEWEISDELRDLADAWNYIRQNQFFAMLIPREHGGLGFSAVAQSTVIAKIASRSLTTAVTVMVPNSLGPGELLVRYGTPAQQKMVAGTGRWLRNSLLRPDGPEVGSEPAPYRTTASCAPAGITARKCWASGSPSPSAGSRWPRSPPSSAWPSDCMTPMGCWAMRTKPTTASPAR